MKIHYCSDLHLEFSDVRRPLPKGEVMILAGDITLACCLNPSNEALFEQGKAIRERTLIFIDQITRRFDRVFYLTGNHEHYQHDITTSVTVLRDALRGVEILDDDVADLGGGVLLVGGTLWTDMNRDSPQSHVMVSNMMNDFRLIRNGKRIFTTHDAVDRHKITMERIKLAATENPSKQIVVATHHAPSLKGVNPRHQGSAANPGYASDLTDFIKSHKSIKHWIFGHTHLQSEFKIGQCVLHTNAQGYPHESSFDTFDMDRNFEVRTAKKKAEAA